MFWRQNRCTWWRALSPALISRPWASSAPYHSGAALSRAFASLRAAQLVSVHLDPPFVIWLSSVDRGKGAEGLGNQMIYCIGSLCVRARWVWGSDKVDLETIKNRIESWSLSVADALSLFVVKTHSDRLPCTFGQEQFSLQSRKGCLRMRDSVKAWWP